MQLTILPRLEKRWLCLMLFCWISLAAFTDVPTRTHAQNSDMDLTYQQQQYLTSIDPSMQALFGG